MAAAVDATTTTAAKGVRGKSSGKGEPREQLRCRDDAMIIKQR